MGRAAVPVDDARAHRARATNSVFSLQVAQASSLCFLPFCSISVVAGAALRHTDLVDLATGSSTVSARSDAGGRDSLEQKNPEKTGIPVFPPCGNRNIP